MCVSLLVSKEFRIFNDEYFFLTFIINASSCERSSGLFVLFWFFSQPPRGEYVPAALHPPPLRVTVRVGCYGALE